MRIYDHPLLKAILPVVAGLKQLSTYYNNHYCNLVSVSRPVYLFLSSKTDSLSPTLLLDSLAFDVIKCLLHQHLPVLMASGRERLPGTTTKRDLREGCNHLHAMPLLRRGTLQLENLAGNSEAAI